MPAKDIFHDNCKNALVKDGWTITDDPLTIKIGTRNTYVDLGAEKVVAAEKDGRKIAVEIKSFIGASEISDLQDALGQFVFYGHFLAQTQPERVLYLAVRHQTFNRIFKEKAGADLLTNKLLRIVVFDEKTEVIIEWIN